MILRQKLKYLRKRMGLSQLELAEKLQVSRQAVSGWEAGSSNPSIENMKSLSKLYSVPLELLLNDDKTLDSLDTEHRDDVPKKRRKKVVLVVFLISIVIVGIVFVVSTFKIQKTDAEGIIVEEIPGEEIGNSGGQVFDLEWD